MVRCFLTGHEAARSRLIGRPHSSGLGRLPIVEHKTRESDDWLRGMRDLSSVI